MSEPARRQVALDLETTGLGKGNRVIEIGCVEIVNRNLTGRQFHSYVYTDCEIEEGALQIHGITTEQLEGKPEFPEILDDLLEFVKDAEVLIHNASFDLGFLNDEMRLAGRQEKFEDCCLKVTDTVALAREKSPGGSSLNQLCDFYGVDRSERKLHGALLDAELLAKVYLRMTGGQMGLSLSARARRRDSASSEKIAILEVPVSPEERLLHEKFLDLIREECAEGRACVWQKSGSQARAPEDG